MGEMTSFSYLTIHLLRTAIPFWWGDTAHVMAPWAIMICIYPTKEHDQTNCEPVRKWNNFLSIYLTICQRKAPGLLESAFHFEYQCIFDGAYPALSSMREITQSMYWYVLCLDLTEAGIWPARTFRWFTHPNWGLIKNINPRRKPEINPPIWAKLSTWGRSPNAKFNTMMKRRVNNAASCKWEIKISITIESNTVCVMGRLYKNFVVCTLFA